MSIGVPNFANPILRGFSPDPSICFVPPSSFFIITSTFEYFPGIAIYHSSNLTVWRLIGHVLNTRQHLDLRTSEPGAGIWASTIRYRQQEKRWYVVTGKWNLYRPQTDERIWPRGFYVWTEDIFDSKKWSDPVFFDQIGFDQDLFWDDDGKVYLSTSHRVRDLPISSTCKNFAIHTSLIDLATGSSLSPPIVIRKSHTGLAEGSHLYKRNGWYYLLTAEGGTESNHSEWVSRSKIGPIGPWEDPKRLCGNSLDEVQSTGHADLVEDGNEQWWAVLLGVRPHKKNGTWVPSQLGKHTILLTDRAEHSCQPKGRETFLVAVIWEDEWPVLNYGKQISLETHGPSLTRNLEEKNWVDQFETTDLLTGWYHKHTPLKRDYSLSARPGYLRLFGGPYDLTAPECPTLVLQRQTQFNLTWSTELDFDPKRPTYEAGTVLWWNNYCFTSIGVRSNNGRKYLKVKQAVDGKGTFEEHVHKITGSSPITLLIKSSALRYEFGYSLPTSVDVTWLSNVSTEIMTEIPPVGNAYAGMMFGLYAFGEMERCLSAADFRYAKWEAS